jgi:hypothetical protein
VGGVYLKSKIKIVLVISNLILVLISTLIIMAETMLNQERIVYGIMVTMETVICCECSVPFAMPQQLKQHLKDTGNSFYCPNGHSQHYTRSTVQKLKDEIAEKERALEWKGRQLKSMQERNQHLGNVVRVTKGHVTKQKNKLKRVAEGVCPCCDKTFKDLAEHMRTKHPEELGGE